jgi:hypothetical protein
MMNSQCAPRIRKVSTRESPLARLLRLSLFLAFILSACGQASPQPPADLPTPVVYTTKMPTATSIPSETPAIAQVSFEPATYRDEDAGFELDYPSSWTADPPQVGGDRGYFAQITSWSRNPGELPEYVPAGETIMSINVLLWDPKNALDEFVDMRRQGWAASGFEILLEEEWALTGDWKAFHFLVQSPEEESFLLITNICERELLISGNGDLDVLVEIARTLRPLGMVP